MTSATIKNKRIAAWFLLISTLTLSAQETKKFLGARVIGNYKGVANFEYVLRDKDTIFEGKFEFGNITKSTNEVNSKPIIVNGSYKNNVPDGQWVFQFGNFVSEGKKELINYKYVIGVSGIQKSIHLNFDTGKPKGNWLIQIDSLKNSEVIKILFKSDINYENGLPQKSFRIETNNEFMVGRLLRNGIAHDVWSLYTKQGIGELENWHFTDGQLKNINLLINDDNKQISLDYGKSIDNATIYLDTHYLDIMELRLQQQDTSHIFDHGISNLLKIDAENYKLITNFFKELGTPVKIPGFKVNVPIFPLSQSQQSSLTEIRALYKKADTIINTVLSDSQLNILKLNDTKTRFFYDMAQKIHDDYLNPISQLIRYEQEDVLQHISREDLIEGLWPNGFPEKIIKLKDSLNRDRSYASDNSTYDFSEQNLEGVLKLTRFTSEISEKLKSDLQQILSSKKRKKTFIDQEKLLITQANSLKKHLDSINKGLPKDIESTLENIRSFTDQNLKLYAQMEEDTAKLNYNKSLIECFKKAKALSITVRDIPKKTKEINEAYVNQVWNPFTATLMDEDIKKRITKAYIKQVIPYYLNEINENLSCANASKISEGITQLQARMLVLKDEDTRRLERKLKRNEDPLDVLKILGLLDQ